MGPNHSGRTGQLSGLRGNQVTVVGFWKYEIYLFMSLREGGDCVTFTFCPDMLLLASKDPMGGKKRQESGASQHDSHELGRSEQKSGQMKWGRTDTTKVLSSNRGALAAQMCRRRLSMGERVQYQCSCECIFVLCRCMTQLGNKLVKLDKVNLEPNTVWRCGLTFWHLYLLESTTQ